MKTEDIQLVSEQGLHGRPADLFVRAANQFSCDVRIKNITKNSQYENAKSILKVLALGIYKNHWVRIQVNGIDEEQAIQDLSYLLKTDFSKEKNKTK